MKKMMFRKKKYDSGIYFCGPDGSGHYGPGRDVVVELYGKEYKKWLCSKGFNIKMVSTVLFNFDSIDIRPDWCEINGYKNRIGYILRAERYGIKICKNEKKWKKFVRKVFK